MSTKITQPSLRSLTDTVEHVLSQRHVVHGYSSAMSQRVIKILGSKAYSDSAPLLGYGVDATAEHAFVRALQTYVRREQEGLEYIQVDTYSDITEGFMPQGGHLSRFDNIVWGSEFRLYQSGDKFIVDSIQDKHFGGEGATADTPFGAIEAYASAYRFFGLAASRIRELPAIVLD